jgi:hypothetical protein
MAMAVALRRLSKGRLPTAFRTAQGALAASALVSPSRFSSAVRFSLLLLLIIIMFCNFGKIANLVSRNGGDT